MQDNLTVIKEGKDRYSIKIYGDRRYILTGAELAKIGDRIRNLILGWEE